MKIRRVDLHTHSIHSDGDKKPEELVEIAKQNNIGVLALTDHDDIEGSKKIVKQNDGDVSIYSGVELTAKVSRGRMHILGYNIDLENENLNKKLKEIKEASIYNVLLYIELLKKEYQIYFPQEEIDALLSIPGNIGRPQLAILLMKYNYVSDIEDAFSNYLNPIYEKTRRVKKGVSKEEVISLILGAGGVPVLAHPVSLALEKEELTREILYLKEMGLKGLEVFHIHLKEEMRTYLLSLAHQYDFIITGGTDYHGETVKPGVYLGSGLNNNVHITEEEITLTKRVKNRYENGL